MAQTRSRVGVNTRTPLSALTVKSETYTGTDRNLLLQDANDQPLVTVRNNGNVGVGTDAPSTKLELQSSTAGAIKIVDGTQGAGKFLVSDAAGVGYWKDLYVFNGTPIAGTFNWGAWSEIGNTAWNRIASLVVKPGANIIYMKLHFITNGRPGVGAVRTYVGLNQVGSNNSYTGETPLVGSTMFSMYQPLDFELNGNFVYNNKTGSNQTIYLNLQSDTTTLIRADWTYGGGINRVQGTVWIENGFYAVPMD